MPLLDELKQKRELILALAAEHGLKDVRVFGSVARREERADSDIDMLVNLDRALGFKNFGFCGKMEELFGRRVDMVFEKGMNPIVRKYAMKDVVSL